MKQKKFLIAAIGLSLIAPSIFAQTFVAGGLQYTIDGDGAVVKANSKADESITIPDSVEYSDGETQKKYAVKGIAASGFFGCTKLKDIVLPKTLTNIGRAAFWNCKSLEEIDIPESVTAINPAVFTACRSIKRISAGKSLKYIEPGSFMQCTSLDNIEIPDENPYFKAEGGTVYTKDGETLLAHAGSAESFAIPQGVKTIANSAFWYCENLKAVTLPTSLTTIEQDAFNGSGLSTVSIPQSVETIGDMAFAYCKSLDTVKVWWTNPPTIALTTFQNNAKTLITPAGTTETYKKTMGWNMFQNITEPTGIESIKAAGKTLNILPQKGMIELESLSFQGKIRIFSATGESMQVITLKRGSKTVCSLSAGIYIIDADGISAMKAAVK